MLTAFPYGQSILTSEVIYNTVFHSIKVSHFCLVCGQTRKSVTYIIIYRKFMSSVNEVHLLEWIKYCINLSVLNRCHKGRETAFYVGSTNNIYMPNCDFNNWIVKKEGIKVCLGNIEGTEAKQMSYVGKKYQKPLSYVSSTYNPQSIRDSLAVKNWKNDTTWEVTDSPKVCNGSNLRLFVYRLVWKRHMFWRNCMSNLEFRSFPRLVVCNRHPFLVIPGSGEKPLLPISDYPVNNGYT